MSPHITRNVKVAEARPGAAAPRNVAAVSDVPPDAGLHLLMELPRAEQVPVGEGLYICDMRTMQFRPVTAADRGRDLTVNQSVYQLVMGPHVSDRHQQWLEVSQLADDINAGRLQGEKVTYEDVARVWQRARLFKASSTPIEIETEDDSHETAHDADSSDQRSPA